ncbi:MAG TPA: hypothetical protein VGL61_29975 [Kofleriaceae bacterium]
MRAAFALCVLAACTVDRRSAALACTDSSSCGGGRACVDGYCVEDGSGACPSGCASCDTTQTPPVCIATNPGGNFTCPSGLACQLTCSTSNGCTNVTCASGSTCTIACTAGDACHSITCNGTSCQITCTAANACHSIGCGGGDNGSCDVMCDGTDACNSVSCDSACACDVSCPDGCGNVSCPSGCDQGSGCSSSISGCNSC